jgi:hypothetical protein
MLNRAALRRFQLSRGSLNSLIQGTRLSRPLTSGGKAPPSAQELHRLYQEQMMDLKSERELLFGFTPDEHEAWTNAGNHTHDQSFLEEIDLVRGTDNLGAQSGEEMNEDATLFAKTEITHQNGRMSSHPTASTGLSHLSEDGQSIQMVNVADKQATQRVAVAQARVVFPPEVAAAFRSGGYVRGTNELVGPKGPIFQCAKLAGIMAAK